MEKEIDTPCQQLYGLSHERLAFNVPAEDPVEALRRTLQASRTFSNKPSRQLRLRAVISRHLPRYAKAMGLHVAAADLGAEKLQLASKLGAGLTIDAATKDPAQTIQKKIGGAHGVVVTAVSPTAFKQAVGMLRRGGTCVLIGLPPGDFPVSVFDMVLNRYTGGFAAD